MFWVKAFVLERPGYPSPKVRFTVPREVLMATKELCRLGIYCQHSDRRCWLSAKILCLVAQRSSSCWFYAHLPKNLFDGNRDDSDKLYSLAVSYIALACQALREFQYKFIDVSRTYGSWPSFKMAGDVFPQSHSKYIPQTPFNPSFIPCMATFSKVMCKDPSHLFQYMDRVTFLPYHFAF